MVFKPLSHLARRSTKAFAHGYAQSLAAASQSSYASSNTPFGQLNNQRVTNRGAASRRDVFSNAATSIASYARGHPPISAHVLHGDAALDALINTWPKHDQEEEWQLIHPTKEKGWRGASFTQSKQNSKSLAAPQASEETPSASIPRSCDDGDSAESSRLDTGVSRPAEYASFTKVDGAWSASQLEPAHDTLQAFKTKDYSVHGSSKPDVRRPHTPLGLPSVPTGLLDAKDIGTKLDEARTEDHRTHVQHILTLEESGHYAAIPALFESLVSLGVVPSIHAYNALMVSATALASSSFEATPKALDVYADMLRRNVRPNIRTYNILLELLASRAAEVVRLKSSMEQRTQRFGGARGISILSHRSLKVEKELLDEDSSLETALRIFKLATTSIRDETFSPKTYSRLIDACAANKDTDNMIKIYAHMEGHGISPPAWVYAPMVQAFAASGDLRSAVECYNEYKHLVSRSESERFVLADRTDSHVYAAVIGSYIKCGRTAGAERFFGKITTSLEPYQDALQEARDVILVHGFVQAQVTEGKFRQAFDYALQVPVTSEIRDMALDMVSVAASDQMDVSIAYEAYNLISKPAMSRNSSISLLAMHLRLEDISAARIAWGVLDKAPNPDESLIEPAVMYAATLTKSGFAEEGLEQVRQVFQTIRLSNESRRRMGHMAEMVDESIEQLSYILIENGRVPSTSAIMTVMWTMIENGGVLQPVAERLLAALGAREISGLEGKDLELALHVEAGILDIGNKKFDMAHSERFAHLLEATLESNVPLSGRTSELICSAIGKIEPTSPALASFWATTRQQSSLPGDLQFRQLNQIVPTSMSSQSVGDGFDPYAKDLDSRGSSIIVDELEKSNGSPSNNLNESLVRFKNIRRAGRHPRYIAYAKLISAAAKEGRLRLIEDIYEMAKHDVPLVTHFQVVRHGWSNILDAMVGAYLTVGNRPLATDYHERMLQIGAAPTANTYGLYITTLKESGRTFDEASEAVKIYRRARSEGVEPTSFLYNALIGKLGKARRIDDCLFYFAEMRSRGVRPTSVTYGTIVNALCRVSDERFAQDLFDEMESMPNYKPRAAPYNSMMQFFLTAKHDSSKVLEFYQRMQARSIKPTMHTYKLLIDTYATLEPIDLAAAEGVLDTIRSSGHRPEAIHYASLIHAKGCVLQDMGGAKDIFNRASRDPSIRPQACLYQAYFESMVANHHIRDTKAVLEDMFAKGVEMTPYIANTLIHGWTLDGNIEAAKTVYDSIGIAKREPSTYEVMTRGFLAAEQRQGASEVVQEMMSRGYPSAVSGKVLELLSHRVPSEVATSSHPLTY